MAANELQSRGIQVRNIITFGTPVREYGLNEGAALNHVNIYHSMDNVQSFFGMADFGDSVYKHAARLMMYPSHKFDDANNVNLNDGMMPGSLESGNSDMLYWLGISGHRELLGNPDVLDAAKNEIID